MCSASGCSTFLKTIAGEMNGIHLETDAQINYQGGINSGSYNFRSANRSPFLQASELVICTKSIGGYMRMRIGGRSLTYVLST